MIAFKVGCFDALIMGLGPWTSGPTRQGKINKIKEIQNKRKLKNKIKIKHNTQAKIKQDIQVNKI